MQHWHSLKLAQAFVLAVIGSSMRVPNEPATVMRQANAL